MADIKILQDTDTGEDFFPVTHEEAVVDEKGNKVIAQLKSELSDLYLQSEFDLIRALGNVKNDDVFTWVEKTCVVSRENTGVVGFSNIIVSEPLDTLIVPNAKYMICPNTDNKNVGIRIFCNTGEGTENLLTITCMENTLVTIPKGTTRVVIRIEVLPNFSGTATISPKVLFSIENNDEFNNVIFPKLDKRFNDIGFNGYELASEIAKFVPHDDGNISYSWENGICSVVGTAINSYFLNFIESEPLHKLIVPGNRYYVEPNTTDENIYVRVFYRTEGATSSESIKFFKKGWFDLPKNTVRFLVRVECVYGATVNGTCEPKIYSSFMNNREIKALRSEGNINGVKKIKVLCIGNSFTLNNIAYVPYILKNLAKTDIDLTIGSTYYSGGKIDDYVGFLENDDAVLRYDKNVSFADNFNIYQNKTLKEILADEEWDIITFQQGSSSQETWSTYSNLNTLINNVLSYKLSIHKKAIKFGWLMPQIRLTIKTDKSYTNIIQCINNLLDSTPIDFVIPCGTAIENARGTSLNDIGDYGGLTNDGAHLQTGLPCLVGSYVTALSILKLIGIEHHGILGEQTRPTIEWSSKHITTATNGTSVGITEENCVIAQKCAIGALKKPFEVSTIN